MSIDDCCQCSLVLCAYVYRPVLFPPLSLSIPPPPYLHISLHPSPFPLPSLPTFLSPPPHLPPMCTGSCVLTLMFQVTCLAGIVVLLLFPSLPLYLQFSVFLSFPPSLPPPISLFISLSTFPFSLFLPRLSFLVPLSIYVIMFFDFVPFFRWHLVKNLL